MLTQTQIAALPAGFELNTLVAEQVLRHRWLYYYRYPGEYVRFMVSPSLLPDLLKDYDLWVAGTSPEARIMPTRHVLCFATQDYDFSGSMKDAWELVEKLKQVGSMGFQLTYSPSYSSWECGPLNPGDYGQPELYDMDCGTGETAPLAICRAALLAFPVAPSPSPSAPTTREKEEG
jgi:hypothetical protein